jgi:hypothetical protein
MMDSSQASGVREDGDEFFIGYAPPMPPRLARYVSRVVIGLACGVLVWAVTVGKHGADALVRGLDGRHVTLAGTRVRRGAHMMIEVDPASLVADDGFASNVTAAAIQARSFGDHPVKVRGEIVDSKCCLGVMVPGSGKTHKDCASLCLRGGIPAALHVQDRAGQSALLLVTGAAGEPIGAHALGVAGEGIDMTGVIDRQGGWLVLRTDPRTWQSVTEQSRSSRFEPQRTQSTTRRRYSPWRGLVAD